MEQQQWKSSATAQCRRTDTHCRQVTLAHQVKGQRSYCLRRPGCSGTFDCCLKHRSVSLPTHHKLSSTDCKGCIIAVTKKIKSRSHARYCIYFSVDVHAPKIAPSLCMVPWSQLSPYPKQHFKRFSHFSRVHSCVQQRHTDHIASVTTCHILRFAQQCT